MTTDDPSSGKLLKVQLWYRFSCIIVTSSMKYSKNNHLISDKMYLALDGCSENLIEEFNDNDPGYYNGNQKVAHIICCSKDGKSCSRKTDMGKCHSGHGIDGKDTWDVARSYCENVGKRLCSSQEELNQCCGTGCQFDNVLVWSDVLKEGK